MAVDGSRTHSATNWDKIRLILWKNFTLQWRYKIQLVIEIAIPLLFFAFLLMLRIGGGLNVEKEPKLFHSFDIRTLERVNQSFFPSGALDFEWKLVCSPKNSIYLDLIRDVSKTLKLQEPLSVSSSKEMEELVIGGKAMAGVRFHGSEKITTLPPKLSYSLRFPSELRNGLQNSPLYLNWHTNELYEGEQLFGRERYGENDGYTPNYNAEGFLQIQNAIAAAFIKSRGKQEMPDILMRRFPAPSYSVDSLHETMEYFLPFFIWVSLIYFCANTVRFIAVEKENQLKEVMKIMGLPNWLHWTGWFVKAAVFLFALMCIVTIILKITSVNRDGLAILTHSEWSVLLVFLIAYCIPTITFCFALSVFFSKAKAATSVASIAWFATYAPFLLAMRNYDNMTTFVKILCCLFSNSAMGIAIKLIMRLEKGNIGLNWSNLWEPATSDDSLSVGLTIILMLIDSVLYMLIALYVEKVRPGEYGVPEKWYFPFSKEYWTGVSRNKVQEDFVQNEESSGDMEPDPPNQHAGIQVKNLRKMYDNKKVVVNGLTINMFDDQITVLLGHNGAGKTTTMSMLTGMFPPTAGTALINGCDIRTNISGARESLGLCPQHNILFDRLTVREHIEFYSRSKGLDPAAVQEEVVKYVRLLELEDKIDAQSHTLSGGMKRKLSVMIAFCGRSKVVMCDEPSSGMDPAARRTLWDLIQSEKKGRTILVSTHFMDEADILGDRIAIMAEGELKCCGSSFFLKQRFGTGYHLVCVKSDGFRANVVTDLLKRYIPNIDMASESRTEVMFLLPDDRIDVFENMLTDLENNIKKLGLSSFGLSLTTLEDVFLKVGVDSSQCEVEKTLGKNVTASATSGLDVNGAEIGSEPTTVFVTGARLLINQWKAMLQKRLIFTIRNWWPPIMQILIAVVIIPFIYFVGISIPLTDDLPPLEISVSKYKRPISILDRRDDADDLLSKIASEYSHTPGLTLLNTKTDILDYYLDSAKDKYENMKRNYLTAASIGHMKNATITAWFNNIPYHTAPLTLNLLHNAVARAIIGPDYSIDVTNEPVPFTPESRKRIEQSKNEVQAFIGIFAVVGLAFGMVYVTAFYTLFYIKERVCKAKLLQFVSGVNVLSFWISAFLWDFLCHLIIVAIIITTLSIFQIDTFATTEELSQTATVFVVFGISVLPMVYLVSMLFKSPDEGFNKIVLINMFTGEILAFILYAVESAFRFSQKTASVLRTISKISPHYALWNSLFNLQMTSLVQRKCDKQCALNPKQCCTINPFRWQEPGVGENIVIMLCCGIVQFGILLAFECGILQGAIYSVLRLFRRELTPETSSNAAIDDDVLQEKYRLNAMLPSEIAEHNLVVRQLSKFYGSFLAVNQVCVAVKEAECFGLIGINGAGKTTTFQMLVGDTRISSGEAYLRGIDLKNNMRKAHQMIGYCPQFDALLDELTGRETLQIFCLLRGIPTADVEGMMMRLAKELQFDKHLDKRISAYSGGNKRKLSTALALVGDPEVIYLDEPTTGMDPGAKRHLWSIVSKIRSLGKSIVLTSHSMEECEALCTRLAIMVNGEFKCLGSTQHLKNKFSKGYSLKIKVGKMDGNDAIYVDNQSVKEFIAKKFPDASLKEDYQELLTYFIPPSDALKWSTMFGLMENAKKQLHIEDYSISQTSLEQVFLSLAKLQEKEIKDQKKKFSILSCFKRCNSKK